MKTTAVTSEVFLSHPEQVLTVRIASDLKVRATMTVLRQDLLAALGEPMEIPAEARMLPQGVAPGVMVPEGERSWRRGWNAKRKSMLEAINRLLPEEG